MEHLLDNLHWHVFNLELGLPAVAPCAGAEAACAALTDPSASFDIILAEVSSTLSKACLCFLISRLRGRGRIRGPSNFSASLSADP